jgi:hypothetical protein
MWDIINASKIISRLPDPYQDASYGVLPYAVRRGLLIIRLHAGFSSM